MTVVSDTALQVTPLSGWAGALITGVDLTAPLAAEDIAAINEALNRWKVVFFRDQALDHAAQIAFGAQFGDVTPGHPYEGDSAPAGFPQIHTVSPAAYDQRYGTRYRKKQSPNGPGWHADVTPLINPPSHSILRAEAVPPYGGDTQFVNVAAVYQGLSGWVQEFIDELNAEHRFGATVSAERSDEKIGDLVRTNPLASIHPVVRVHPETGRKLVYVNALFTTRLTGISTQLGDSLRNMLTDLARTPEYQVRFRWEPNSLVIWDNRSTQHYAVGDYHPHYRLMHRVTLKGDRPA